MDIFKELYPNSILNRQCLDYLKFFIDRILSRLSKPTSVEILETINLLDSNLSFELLKYIHDNIIDFNTHEEYLNLILINIEKFFYIKIFTSLTADLEVVYPKDIFIAIFNSNDLRFLIFCVCPSPFPTGEKELTAALIMKYSEELINNNITDIEIATILSQICNYIKKLYYRRAVELLDHIGKSIKFFRTEDNLKDLVHVIIIIIRNNIRINNYDLENPMFYISSLYDNRIIDFKTVLSYSYSKH